MSDQVPNSPTPPSSDFNPGRRTWPTRFGDAFRGIAQGIRGQPTFAVHFAVAAIVLVAAAVSQLTVIHWCLLILCIGFVMAMELVNSALEWACRAITDQNDSRIKQALEIASGAVLVAALTSAVVGGVVFLDGLFWVEK